MAETEIFLHAGGNDGVELHRRSLWPRDTAKLFRLCVGFPAISSPVINVCVILTGEDKGFGCPKEGKINGLQCKPAPGCERTLVTRKIRALKRRFHPNEGWKSQSKALISLTE